MLLKNFLCVIIINKQIFFLKNFFKKISRSKIFINTNFSSQIMPAKKKKARKVAKKATKKVAKKKTAKKAAKKATKKVAKKKTAKKATKKTAKKAAKKRR